MKLFVPREYAKNKRYVFLPHNGIRERARRLRQIARGTLRLTQKDEWISPVEAQNRLLQILK